MYVRIYLCKYHQQVDGRTDGQRLSELETSEHEGGFCLVTVVQYLLFHLYAIVYFGAFER